MLKITLAPGMDVVILAMKAIIQKMQFLCNITFYNAISV